MDGNVKSRLLYVDVARGVTMLCVILGHMAVGRLNYIIFSFHMPLFFLVSGYFLRTDSLRGTVRKRAKGLLLPYIFTSAAAVVFAVIENCAKMAFPVAGMEPPEPLPGLLLKWVVAALLGSGGREVLFFEESVSIGAIWFLLAMFFSVIAVSVLLRKKHCWIYIAVIAAIGIISANYFWLPLSFQAALAASVYIYCGWLIRGDRLNKILCDAKAVVVCFGIWIGYLALCFIFEHRISVSGAKYAWGPVDFVGTISAVIAVLWLCRAISGRISILVRFLSWFGKNSLIVLCFHDLENLFVPFERAAGLALSALGIYNTIVLNAAVYAAKVIWACCAIAAVHRIAAMRQIFCPAKKA